VNEERIFMKKLGKKLGIKFMDDWYNLTAKTVIKNRGNFLM
jgi:hypothetical protein